MGAASLSRGNYGKPVKRPRVANRKQHCQRVTQAATLRKCRVSEIIYQKMIKGNDQRVKLMLTRLEKQSQLTAADGVLMTAPPAAFAWHRHTVAKGDVYVRRA